MGILNNYSNQNLGQCRFQAGGAVSLSRGNINTNRPWLHLRWLAREGQATALNTAIPTGAYPRQAWRLPLDAGEMSMDATGSSTVVLNLYPAKLMAAAIQGNGSINASAARIVQMLANILASGTLGGPIQGRANLAVVITGSGTLAATITALGNMIAALNGSGSLDATVAAYGNMELEITVTGVGLSTANVGQAVWNHLLGSGLTAGDIERLLAAYIAGKTTIDDHGGGAATVVFRDPADTKDAITAEMQDSEKQSIVLDVS